jgi:tetratricopeptide (TPR) repeat protein
MIPSTRPTSTLSTPFAVMALFLVIGLGGTIIGCESVKKTLSTPPSVKLQQDGDHEFKWGRYESAAVFYKRILDREPGNPKALEMYGRCMLKLDRPADAANAFLAGTAHRPGDRSLLFLLARAEFASGSYDRSFQLVRTWAIDNEDSEAWLLLASFALELDDPDNARDAIERAIELDATGSAAAYLAAADLAERLGDTDLALRRLRQAYGIEVENDEIADRLREYGEIPGPTVVLPPGV